MKEKSNQPMTGEQILFAKFNACMTNNPLKCSPTSMKITKKLNEFDKSKFHDLLVKHDMGKYSELLFNYIFNIVELHELNKNSYADYIISDREDFENKSGLLKILYFLLKENHLETQTIRFGKNKTTHSTIRNDRLITELETFLGKQYKENFRKMYSTQEIELELQSEKNSKWINEWLDRNGIQYNSNKTEFYPSIIDDKQYHVTDQEEEMLGIDIKKQLISDYRRTHSKGPELNLKAIEELLKEYNGNYKSSRGKNEFMTLLAAELSDLIRINRFLLSQKTDDIDEFKLNYPGDYQFIYECLDFWTLIPDLEDNASMPEDYMSTTIKQGAKYFTPQYYTSRKERLKALKELFADYF